MRIIPVIDIRNGNVVAAREGHRETYPRLTSTLTDQCDPTSVIDALLMLHAFSTIYVADLDALMGCGSQWSLLEALAARFGELTFWIDQGLTERSLARPLPENVVPVIGTESMNAETLRGLQASGIDFILSLDFRGDSLLGEQSVAQDTAAWPDRVIVMSLSHVGTRSGPDFARLRDFRRLNPTKQLIAAGGIRHDGDLKRLEAMGLDAVLLATALHSGAIAPENLRGY